VPVTLLPAQALGVERPRARPRPQAAAPTPPAPAPPAAAEPPPKPAPKPQAPAPKTPPEEKPIRRETEHEIPPEVERRPALKNVQEESLPKPERARPERPTRESAAEKAPGRRTPERAAAPSRGPAGPGGLADVGKGDEVGRRGSATGNPLGSSAFGSSIAGLEDPDFGYGYYIDRLLQLIDANWTRPPVGGEVRAVVYFRIQKSGQIADLRIEQPSGYNAFDLAALRAVQNAAPFPALPASYRHDSLGVNLIVH
jgi:periplasmic protein TonB